MASVVGQVSVEQGDFRTLEQFQALKLIDHSVGMGKGSPAFDKQVHWGSRR